MGINTRNKSILLKLLSPLDSTAELVSKLQFNFDKIVHEFVESEVEVTKVEVSIPGPTGVGKKGVKGDTGSVIEFSPTTLSDNSVTTLYPELGVIIDPSSNIFKVEKVGSELKLIKKLNLQSLSDLDFVNQSVFSADVQNGAINRWVVVDESTPGSLFRNVILGKRSANGVGNDKSEFFKLLLGLDSDPTLSNSTLLLCNILPDNTVANSNFYAQFGLKYRTDSTAAPSLGTVWHIFKNLSSKDIYTIENDDVSTHYVQDLVTPSDSFYAIKSKFVKFVGDSLDILNPTNFLNFEIGNDEVIITPEKAMKIASASTGVNSTLKFGFKFLNLSALVSEITTINFDNNIIFDSVKALVFNSKIVKNSTIVTLGSAGVLDISTVKTQLIQVSTSNFNNRLIEEITGGEDGQIIQLFVQNAITTPNALSDIYIQSGTNIFLYGTSDTGNRQIPIKTDEFITLIHKDGVWSQIGQNSKAAAQFDAQTFVTNYNNLDTPGVHYPVLATPTNGNTNAKFTEVISDPRTRVSADVEAVVQKQYDLTGKAWLRAKSIAGTWSTWFEHSFLNKMQTFTKNQTMGGGLSYGSVSVTYSNTKNPSILNADDDEGIKDYNLQYATVIHIDVPENSPNLIDFTHTTAELQYVKIQSIANTYPENTEIFLRFAGDANKTVKILKHNGTPQSASFLPIFTPYNTDIMVRGGAIVRLIRKNNKYLYIGMSKSEQQIEITAANIGGGTTEHSSKLYIKKENDYVYCQGYLNLGISSTIADQAVMFTVPDFLRPSRSIAEQYVIGSTEGKFFTLGSNGQIKNQGAYVNSVSVKKLDFNFGYPLWITVLDVTPPEDISL